MERIRPVLNGMNLDDVLSQPHLVVTNLSRYGERLDYYLVRCSRCNPHFINRDCFKDAIVYGESDYIGPFGGATELVNAYSYYNWDRVTATEIVQRFKESLDNKDKVKIGELK